MILGSRLLGASLTSAALMIAACSPPATDTKAPEAPPAPVAIEAPSGDYTLDKNHSSLTVRALHFGLSNYTLRFTDFDAALSFDAADPTKSTITATVQVPSIETDYPGENDFDAELQNSQWLNAAQHPVASFQSTAVTLTGPNTGQVTGDLTFNGQTHPATFDVTFNAGYARHPMGRPVAQLGFSGRAVIKRSEYGLNVLLPTPGGVGVSDEVELIIESEFVHPLEEQPTAPAQ